MLQPSPGALICFGSPAGKRRASGQCPPLAEAHIGNICTLRRRLLGYQQALATTLLMQGRATVLPKASKPPRDHPTFAEETLDTCPNTLATGLGICPDNGRTAAPTQQLLPRGRQMNRHKARYLTHTIKHPGCRHVGSLGICSHFPLLGLSPGPSHSLEAITCLLI